MEHIIPVEIIRQVIRIAVISEPILGCKLALVCKAAHDWVTPVLYRDITLATDKALADFRNALIQNASLGAWTRSLWIGIIKPLPATKTSEAWPRYWLGPALSEVMPRVPNLKRLALIGLPPISTASWSEIEDVFPPTLECFAAGPIHAVLQKPEKYPSLKWFCSIDTSLVQEEFNILLKMPKLRDFHWCFIDERIDLQSVRRLSEILQTRKWNSVCLYIIEGDEIDLGGPDDLDIDVELVTLYEDQRVKRYQLFHVEDWLSAFYKHWTIDWVY